MKILNIDAFAQTTRQLSLGGNLYAVEEPSVQQFIDNLKASESLEAEVGTGPEALTKSFEQAVAAICQAIPTLDVAEVRKFKLPAITAVLQFIRGELDPDAVAVAKAAPDAPDAPGAAPSDVPAGGEEEKKPS